MKNIILHFNTNNQHLEKKEDYLIISSKKKRIESQLYFLKNTFYKIILFQKLLFLKKI